MVREKRPSWESFFPLEWSCVIISDTSFQVAFSLASKLMEVEIYIGYFLTVVKQMILSKEQRYPRGYLMTMIFVTDSPKLCSV